MKVFKNLKTAQKILSLIFIIAILLLISGTISFINARKADTMVISLFENRLVAMDDLNSARADIRANEANIYKLIIATNIKDQSKYLLDINKRTNRSSQALSEYKKTELDKYELDNIKIIDDEIKKYKTIKDKTINLIMAGNKIEAISFYQNNLSLINNITAGLDDLTKYNRNQANKEYRLIIKAYLHSSFINLFGAFITTIAAIFFGLLIARMISSPLKVLTLKMKQVTDGNLYIDPVKVESNDEIGTVSTCFNSMTKTIQNNIEREKALRYIIIETRKMDNPEEMFEYLLNTLINLFEIDRAVHLKKKEDNQVVYVEIEAKKENLKSLCEQAILNSAFIENMKKINIGDFFIINDVNNEIMDQELKETLKSANIQTFMLYLGSSSLSQNESNLLGNIMISSSFPHIWSTIDIDAFKLIVDTFFVSFLENYQRKEVEETKNTFIATLTHDMRSPINAEQKVLEAILSGKFGQMLDNFSEFLQDFYKINEELLKTVNNILTIYHYESGQFELHTEPVNLKNIIEESTKSMSYLAMDQDSEIIINIEPDIDHIIADKNEIKRVITNLLNNAIKHNKKGTNITISARMKEDKIEISVSDNGKGIPEADRSRIFQRYPTKKRTLGTGLGLYISKQIIEAHNGDIWFNTEEGKGTTFYFTLPMS